ncbi:DUF4132 domain-containing protein [Catenuloplanes sp. NPDC051500]|uniref:DUF4132 domain-containing protein n=1 Tax=Catenuloplanes sp. NPDC051500 TaxID=3363959 RepID=UPI0037ADC58F
MRFDHGWDMPADWLSSLLPRHGGRPVPPPKIGPDAPAELRARLAASDLAARQYADYDDALCTEAERFVAALNDPGADLSMRGAAAAGLFMAEYANMVMWPSEPLEALLAEALIARGGLVFAAHVVSTMSGLIHHPDLAATSLCIRPIRVPADRGWHENYTPVEARQHGEDWVVWHTASAVRAHLAAADDETRAAVARRMESERDGPLPQRIVASFMLPDRAEWVDADIAAIPGWFGESLAHQGSRIYVMPVFSASTADQLVRWATAAEALPASGCWWDLYAFYGSDPVLATLLDGVGPAAVSVITSGEGWLRAAGFWTYRHGYLTQEALTRLMRIPADESLHHVALTTIEHRQSDAHTVGLLTRDPVRAARVLSGPGLPPTAADLAAMLVMTGAAARDLLAADDLARIDAHIGDGRAVGARIARELDEVDLENRWPRYESDVDRRQSITWLSRIPTDGAFRMLAERADRRDIRPVVLKLAARTPERALRVLASSAPERPEAAAVVAELLRDHVLTHPALSLGELDVDAHARVTAIIAAHAATGPAAPENMWPDALRTSGKTKPLPVWVVIPTLPPIRLTDDAGALTEAAVRRLFALLTASTFAAPAPGLAEVRDTCDRTDLAAFALELFAQWQRAEHPAADKQALLALGFLADDSVVTPLTDVVIAWTEDAIARAKLGLDVFVALGTDAAIAGLLRLSKSTKQKGFRKQAEAKLVTIADARGLTPAELAERVTPDLGLDPDGRMTLDYGPRRFTVTFDVKLNPIVLDQDGRRLRSLPRAAATDDAERAEQAKRAFAALKKAARTLAVERGRALEDAMVTGRRWSVPDLRRFVLDHPAVRHLARALIWQVQDGHAFRIAEDGTLASLGDDTLTLADDQHISLWHPAADTDQRAWAEVLADYEIFQPFTQVGRAVHTLTPEQAAARVIPSHTGRYFEVEALHPVAARGWRHNADGGVERDWPGGFTTQVRLEDIAVIAPAGAVFGDLGPIAASETLLAAERLHAAA